MINELFKPEGFGWAAGFVQDLPHGDLVILNLEQFYERGPIRGAALDRMNAVYPHLARAAVIAGRADFARVQTAIETLAALGLPAAALTPSARVTLANDAFASATHIWTTRGGDKLALHDRTADLMLLATPSTLSGLDSPRSIPVRKDEGGRIAAVLQVVPIRRAAHDVFGSSSAIVVLSEPRADGREATLVQSLFDLTNRARGRDRHSRRPHRGGDRAEVRAQCPHRAQPACLDPAEDRLRPPERAGHPHEPALGPHRLTALNAQAAPLPCRRAAAA